MFCPSCKSPLVILEFEAIELDFCTSCGGTWLDAGELETIAARAGVAPGKLSNLVAGVGVGDNGTRRCVRCAARMEVARTGADESIALDRCPRGHGLWCDSGEIRRLVIGAAGEEPEVSAVARFFAGALGSRL